MTKMFMLFCAFAILFSLTEAANSLNKREIDSTIMGSLMGGGV